MSALTPNILMLRALGAEYLIFADKLDQAAKVRDGVNAAEFLRMSALMDGLAGVHRKAADRLEAAEPQLRVEESTFKFNPKGKPPT